GASRIDVYIKNAGKTLIQITDNGCGMSAQDARMCFERHATSKIRQQDDLFNIRTLGFRGEALASIAAVAQVSMRTRLHEEELGVEVEIEASKIKNQQPWAGPGGTTFLIKNLFFNVPARRNFLKSNPVEARHILNEFTRVAIPNHDIYFSLKHNDTDVYDLPPSSLEQRIVSLLGNDLRGKLKKVDEATGYVTIHGFVGDPSVHRKSRGDQYFFVNNRFIKSNYLHHAIAGAFQDFIPKETHPFYVIFLGIDPVHVDINIHPTKTEVKFDDEKTLYVLLQSVIKQSLGAVHNSPEVDFHQSDITRSIYGTTQQRKPGDITIGNYKPKVSPQENIPKGFDWDQLYGQHLNPAAGKEKKVEKTVEKAPTLFGNTPVSKAQIGEEAIIAQFLHSYILMQKDEQLYLIDQYLAHQRILFEKFLKARAGKNLPCQQMLFPQTMEFAPADFVAIREVDSILVKMGFEVKEFGRNTLIVYGMPSGIASGKLKEIFDQVIADVKEAGTTQVADKLFESVVRSVAMRSAVGSRQKMSMIEMKNMVNDLFRCEVPDFAPNGKPTYKVITAVELEAFFR
ncbi:MAG: DNA mismatch repair protein MutL, partial [Bacteroidetes bacterium]|nr:DNA mismatch repair protein MutL [Bacteroidota bacterium]